MSHANLSIHNVTNIIPGKRIYVPAKPDCPAYAYQEITILDNAGYDFRLTLFFADKHSSLEFPANGQAEAFNPVHNETDQSPDGVGGGG